MVVMIRLSLVVMTRLRLVVLTRLIYIAIYAIHSNKYLP